MTYDEAICQAAKRRLDPVLDILLKKIDELETELKKEAREAKIKAFDEALTAWMISTHQEVLTFGKWLNKKIQDKETQK